jgi:hypothetical protein
LKSDLDQTQEDKDRAQEDKKAEIYWGPFEGPNDLRKAQLAFNRPRTEADAQGQTQGGLERPEQSSFHRNQSASMPASESEQRHADIVPAIFLNHPPVVSGVAPPGGWYLAPSHESQFAVQQPASSSEITGADAAGLSQEGQDIPEVPSPQYDE